ncbi:hypothetical protein BC936DRAFT_144196, partial [Jimgerdemannia flammicorona]
VNWTEDGQKINALGVSTNKTLSFFNKDIKLDHSDTKDRLPTIRQTPHYIPVILAHSRLIVYCFLAPGQTPCGKILLEGQIGNELITDEITVERVDQGDLIHTLAAQQMITSIEEETSYLHHTSEGKYKSISPNEKKAEITAMGLQFSLATIYTSFVAVVKNININQCNSFINTTAIQEYLNYTYDSDNDSNKDSDDVEYTTLGGGGRGSSIFSIEYNDDDTCLRGGNKKRDRISHTSDSIHANKRHKNENIMSNPPTLEDLYLLLNFKMFNGAFKVDNKLAILLGFDGGMSDLLDKMKPINSDIQDNNIWITLFVIAFLEVKMLDFKEVWEFI